MKKTSILIITLCMLFGAAIASDEATLGGVTSSSLAPITPIDSIMREDHPIQLQTLLNRGYKTALSEMFLTVFGLGVVKIDEDGVFKKREFTMIQPSLFWSKSAIALDSDLKKNIENIKRPLKEGDNSSISLQDKVDAVTRALYYWAHGYARPEFKIPAPSAPAEQTGNTSAEARARDGASTSATVAPHTPPTIDPAETTPTTRAGGQAKKDTPPRPLKSILKKINSKNAQGKSRISWNKNSTIRWWNIDKKEDLKKHEEYEQHDLGDPYFDVFQDFSERTTRGPSYPEPTTDYKVSPPSKASLDFSQGDDKYHAQTMKQFFLELSRDYVGTVKKKRSHTGPVKYFARRMQARGLLVVIGRGFDGYQTPEESDDDLKVPPAPYRVAYALKCELLEMLKSQRPSSAFADDEIRQATQEIEAELIKAAAEHEKLRKEEEKLDPSEDRSHLVPEVSFHDFCNTPLWQKFMNPLEHKEKQLEQKRVASLGKGKEAYFAQAFLSRVSINDNRHPSLMKLAEIFEKEDDGFGSPMYWIFQILIDKLDAVTLNDTLAEELESWACKLDQSNTWDKLAADLARKKIRGVDSHSKLLSILDQVIDPKKEVSASTEAKGAGAGAGAATKNTSPATPATPQTFTPEQVYSETFARKKNGVSKYRITNTDEDLIIRKKNIIVAMLKSLLGTDFTIEDASRVSKKPIECYESLIKNFYAAANKPMDEKIFNYRYYRTNNLLYQIIKQFHETLNADK